MKGLGLLLGRALLCWFLRLSGYDHGTAFAALNRFSIEGPVEVFFALWAVVASQSYRHGASSQGCPKVTLTQEAASVW